VWPKTEQKQIEIIDVQEERCGLTHIACAIVLVFLVAAKADMPHPVMLPLKPASNASMAAFRFWFSMKLG